VGATELRHRLVLLSGGLDSGAVLHTLGPGPIRALFVDYGHASAQGELAAAQRLAVRVGTDLEVAYLPGLAPLGAGRLVSQAAASIADGDTGLQRDEWFPARNLVLIAVAGVLIGRDGGGDIWLGAADPVYRDGQPAFYMAAEAVLRESLPSDVRVLVPDRPRVQVLRDAVAAGLDVRDTFSCNRRGDRHCWRCASCRDRRALTEKLDRDD
jgi:7-cyano-7-deazaguanine synthase